MKTMILFVHGRSWKIPCEKLKALWTNTVLHGMKRDNASNIALFEQADIEMVYYGDKSNEKLIELGRTAPNFTDLIEDQYEELEYLKKFRTDQFSKETYKIDPFRKGCAEFFADTVGSLLGKLKIGKGLIHAVAPELAEYWNHDSEFGTDVRFEMIEPLKRALNEYDRVIVLAHSLGTLISYDSFWKFSYYGEYRDDYSSKKIHSFISFGSPLGDDFAKASLKGAELHTLRKYPKNIEYWYNFKAIDDYIAHDDKIADDYKEMSQHVLAEPLTDTIIENLAKIKKDDKLVPDPHSSLGYLIHPKMIKTLNNCLEP